MRKQMKVAAVLSATALLAIGASFTAMAAAKTGTWMLEDEGWVCYDKDGDVYENVFCLDGGKEYYVGDDGVLVTEDWVEDEDGTYYVGAAGAKTINDWRFVIPEDGEDEDEAEWFYFNAKGKKVTGKKVIDGNTYYFDEEGIMLTGWVDVSGEYPAPAEKDAKAKDLVYCAENGARMASTWINTFVPGTEEEDQEDADTFWYYIKSKGGVQTGRNLDINGETYYFDADGKMLSGWVVGADTNDDGKDDAFVATKDSDDFQTGNIYFCGTEDQGWAKKNTWVKTWAPEDFEDADADVDTYWYWINKNGVVFTATNVASSANAVTFVDGEVGTFKAATDDYKIATKEINNKTYAFKKNGQMWSGLVDVEGNVYYYGKSSDGAMKTGLVSIADKDDYEYKFFFGEKDNDEQGYKKGVAVTGQADGKLFENGLLVTTDNKYEEVEVNEVFYLIDEDGDIRTSKKKYVNGDDVTVLDATKDGFKFNTDKGIFKGSYTK